MNRSIKNQKQNKGTIFDEQSQKLKIIIQKPKDSSLSNLIFNRQKERYALQNEIKIESLTKKLKNRQASVIIHQNKGNPKQQKINNRKDKISKKQQSTHLVSQNGYQKLMQPRIYQIKQTKDRFCNQISFEIRMLNQHYEQICKKIEQNKAFIILKYQKNKDSALYIQRSIQQIKKNLLKLSQPAIELKFLVNNFKKLTNLNSQVLKYEGLLKQKNSIPMNHDGSLLLSFKKNLDEDDSFLAFKYSEQSVKNPLLKHEKYSEVNRQTFESFSKDKMSNIAHKLSYYDRVVQSEQSELQKADVFTIAKDHIHDFLSQQNSKLQIIKQQAIKGQTRCQNIFENMLYQVASQKVERQDEFKQLLVLLDHQFYTIMEQMQQIQSRATTKMYQFQQKVTMVKQNIQQKLQEQSELRKKDEKLIIKMLFEVVQFLQ